MKKEAKAGIIILAIIILIGGGIGLYYFVNESKPVDLAKCNSIQDLDERDFCYYNLAVETSDVEICDTIQNADQHKLNQEYKNSCYRDVAEAKKDVAICEKIINRQTIKDVCYWQVSKVTSNISLCGDIESERSKELCVSGLG